MLYDPVLDMEREVDVVIRGRVNEIDVVISFEVVDYSRKADVQWVEGKLKKNEHLPTDKLMLVSWKGFTEGAKRLAASRPDIVLMAPKPVPAGQPRSLMLYADTIKFTLDRATLDLTTSSGEARRVTGFTMDTSLYDGDGNDVGSLGAYLVAMFAKNEVPRELLVEAHHRDDRGRSDRSRWG